MMRKVHIWKVVVDAGWQVPEFGLVHRNSALSEKAKRQPTVVLSHKGIFSIPLNQFAFHTSFRYFKLGWVDYKRVLLAG